MPFQEGGIVDIQNNILNKERADICGFVNTPAAVNNEPKIHGIKASGEEPPTGGRGFWRRGTMGDPYAE